MSLFTDAYMGINEEPHWLTDEGSEVLYDIFEHFSNGGTIHDFEDLKSEYVVFFLALAMRSIRQTGIGPSEM